MKKAAPKRNQKLTLALGGVIALVLAYAFGSLAVDSGSYWHYLGAVVSVIVAIKLFVRIVKNYVKTIGARKTEG
ncbi:MAG TPA: hypothetical protein VK674_05000 [Candidatus Limnocylindria bacterium]|nr:hypothetical protein [Candidatus Limnocylindria bacterium]